MNCPRCGYKNEPAANFCSNCGLGLKEILGQRRRVAIVFADISGFTALSERLDPEDLKELIDNCLKKLARVIQNYGGYVDKFIGDCIMALFGAPSVHEDDPLRAVLAALDLQNEIQKFNEEKGQRLSLAVGINYGLVATGDLGRTGAFTVMGDVVNLAKRLQEAAPAGKIYVSQSIYEDTKNEIEYKKLSPISVKGKTQKVSVYLPVKVKHRFSQRKIREIPLVGRVSELNQLKKLFSDVQTFKGRFISIVGEAGIGKTKLVYEFKKTLFGEHKIIEGKGIEYLSNSPYFVLKEILKKIFVIEEGLTPLEVETRIEKFIKEFDEPVISLKLPFYKYILSAHQTPEETARLESMKPEDRVRLTDEAIISLFFTFARKNPLIIILDDCHWVDKETMEFFYKLTESIGYKPVMIIALYRPDFKIGRVGALPYFTKISLKPLIKHEIMDLLKSIFKCPKIDEELFKFLLDKSGAIPLYIYELANSLLENDLIAIEKNRARLKILPPHLLTRTVDELVMAKVDRLPSDLRHIINAASVIGEEFSLNILKEIIPDEKRLKSKIDLIEEMDIIKSQVEIGEKGQEETEGKRTEHYGFKHSIIRDAIYNSLLKKERRLLHKKIGYALERIYFNNLAEYYDTIANHFLCANEIDKAIYYLERSADRKKELYSNEEAINIYKKCLTLISRRESERIAGIYEKIGLIYELIGNNNQARDAFENMEKYTKDKFRLARAYYLKGNVLKNFGQYDAALRLLNAAKDKLTSIRSASGIEIVNELSSILNSESWIYQIKGKMDTAEKIGKEAITLITGLKNWHNYKSLKGTLANAYKNLSQFYYLEGKLNEAINLCKNALRLAEEIQNQQIKGTIYTILGMVYKTKGEYEKAIESYKRQLKISEELGDKTGVGIAHGNLGNVYQSKGEYDNAIYHHEKYLKISEECGDQLTIATAINNIGIDYFNKGEYHKAIESFEKYLNLSKKIGSKRGMAIAYGNLGELYMNQFEYQKATKFFKRYLKISEKLKYKTGIGTATLNLGQVYLETNNRKLAKKYLNLAWEIFNEIGNKNAIGFVLNNLAKLKLKENNQREAIELVNKSLNIAGEINNQELRILGLLNRGEIYTAFDTIRAEEDFVKAVEGARKLNNIKILGDACYKYAEFLKKIKKSKESKKFLKEAVVIYKGLGIKKIPKIQDTSGENP
uniref:Tetratricopeptide repeat protein n=1 Tax=candidate division WOR-3 bacterium TaxID=2052148 RepID=A0A7C4TBB4_UNCW3